MGIVYKQPHENAVFSYYTSNGKEIILEKKLILDSLQYSHEIIDEFKEFRVDVFSILGMRNLSSFIGEIFAASIVKQSNGFFRKNPHQDGYPDLLTMDEEGQLLWTKLKLRLREKQPFSPFANGGIEVKATCGSVPTPQKCKKMGIIKPDIGDQRINVLNSYDWKAHHRETNNLLGILWDFIYGIPRIVAIFFSNNLTIDDWGNIIKPKTGGGRTTSVSIMPRTGVKKMYEGTLFVIDDIRYHY